MLCCKMVTEAMVLMVSQLVDKYLDSIKGVGVYRANAHRYSDNPPQVKGIPSSDAK